MIKINTTQKDFFENNYFVLTNRLFNNDIVEIEFTDSKIELIVQSFTKIYFSDDSPNSTQIINFLGANNIFNLNKFWIDRNLYKWNKKGDKLENVKESYNSQHLISFNEIRILKETEFKNFKRLGGKK